MEPGGRDGSEPEGGAVVLSVSTAAADAYGFGRKRLRDVYRKDDV